MAKRGDIAESVRKQLGKLTPGHRREVIAALQAVIDAEMMSDAAQTEVRCCPVCGSVSIRKHGSTKSGGQRWRCRDCGKTFTAATGTILGATKLKAEVWKRYVECFVDRLPLRTCSVRCGVSLKAAFFMRHRILECLYKLLPSFQVEEGCEAELDETFFRESFKGNHARSTNFKMPRPPRRHGGKLHTRGISNEQICVMTGVNDYGDIFYEIAKRGPLSKAAAQRVLSDKVKSGAIISTDKAAGYRLVLPKLGVAAHGAYGSKDRSGGTINRINNVHSLLDAFMEPFRGVSTRRLGAYLAWFKWLRTFDRKDGSIGDLALRQVAQGSYDTKWRDYKNAPYLFMEYWEEAAA